MTTVVHGSEREKLPLSSSLVCSLAHQNERIHRLMRDWCSGKLNGCPGGELRAIVTPQIPWETAHLKEGLGPPVLPPCPLPRDMNPSTMIAASGVLLVLSLRVATSKWMTKCWLCLKWHRILIFLEQWSIAKMAKWPNILVIKLRAMWNAGGCQLPNFHKLENY